MLPEKKKVQEYGEILDEANNYVGDLPAEAIGWNDCIDAVKNALGEGL